MQSSVSLKMQHCLLTFLCLFFYISLAMNCINNVKMWNKFCINECKRQGLLLLLLLLLLFVFCFGALAMSDSSFFWTHCWNIELMEWQAVGFVGLAMLYLEDFPFIQTSQMSCNKIPQQTYIHKMYIMSLVRMSLGGVVLFIFTKVKLFNSWKMLNL